ncbi:MAG TPA: NADH-quinone oxidoreductase subunit NuoE [Phycicoccus sp.]|nr:NADH-quinone oxidoreductase subunit NuoE [Phycicoccus sp.]HRA44521.1 NADH-quinone oxidoreductase subunit NuoE [Phycicoccus sp.]
MSGHFGRQTASGHLTVPAESKAAYAVDVEERFRADSAEIIARYPQKRSALLPMLHLVQSIDGYITGRGIDLCAELLDLTTAEVSGVATFYTQYKRHPNGRYTVGVCTNTLCAVMGGDAIWDAVSEHLGIGHDETTDDGMITLERIECNAACDFAPVVMTNWEFFDNQTPDSTIELVDALRAGEQVKPSRGADTVVSFQDMSRVLAGFLDGRADEGVGANGASLAGLEVAHEHGWHAPAYPSSESADDKASDKASDKPAEAAEPAAPAAQAQTLFDAPKAQTRGDFADGGFGEGSAKPAADGTGPTGWDIKGNANSMLFHTPDSPWYGRTKAEVWFREEEAAKAAGFTDARERRTKNADGSDKAEGDKA